jgi:5-methylcytosine-specific restriction endonuclease McrA
MDYLKLEPYQTILVLNASFEPLNFCNWKRAIVLLMKNKAQALGKRVIRLVNYIKLPYEKLMQTKPSRTMIYKRDGHKCQYCGSTRELTIDHIIPRSRGGEDTWENLVVACMPCNMRKGNKLLEDTNMILQTIPKKPFNKMLFSLDRANVPEWKEYCYS